MARSLLWVSGAAIISANHLGKDPTVLNLVMLYAGLMSYLVAWWLSREG